MNQAQTLPFNTWQTTTTTTTTTTRPINLERMKKVVDENAVIVFGRHGCCMTHVVRRLLLGLGVNPAVYEVDEPDEASVVADLQRIGNVDGGVCFPTVFIGGRWFGGLDRVMATHITGELMPILKQAGALWL